MGVTWEQWRKAAAKPRMLALLVLVLIGAALFSWLGSWQLDRAALRGAAEAERIAAERIAADPRPLDEVIAVGDTFLSEHQLVKVKATGQWGRQVLVPERDVAGTAAVLIVSELRLDSGAWIAVLRGWLPAAGGPLETLPETVAELAPAPEGGGEVVGFLTGGEESIMGQWPPGVVGSISTAALANEWGGPTYTGFMVVEDAELWGLHTMPPPSYAQELGMNLQNLFYAVEWFVFGGFALFVWWRWVRDDAQRSKEAELLAAADV